MTRQWWNGLLISGMSLGVAACAKGRVDTPSPTEIPARVEVTNNYALPVEIYAIGRGTTHRLGTVNPGLSSSFTLPPTMVGNGAVEFQARLTGTSTQRYRSAQLLIGPGSIVDMVVQPQLFASTAVLRP